MGYRYQSPPNWPAPPSGDWLPPKGWKPDPTWPAAPEGWNFWVDDPTFAGPPAAATAAPRQNPIRERLHQAVLHDLRTGEELRWYGVVYEYKAPPFIVGLFGWSILLPIVGPLIALMLRRTWYVAVTSERVMLSRYDYAGKRKETSLPWTSVPLGEVTVLRKGRKHGKLLVAHPVEKLPAKFTLFRGSNVDELEALLGAAPVPA